MAHASSDALSPVSFPLQPITVVPAGPGRYEVRHMEVTPRHLAVTRWERMAATIDVYQLPVEAMCDPGAAHSSLSHLPRLYSWSPPGSGPVSLQLSAWSHAPWADSSHVRDDGGPAAGEIPSSKANGSNDSSGSAAHEMGELKPASMTSQSQADSIPPSSSSVVVSYSSLAQPEVTLKLDLSSGTTTTLHVRDLLSLVSIPAIHGQASMPPFMAGSSRQCCGSDVLHCWSTSIVSMTERNCLCNSPWCVQVEEVGGGFDPSLYTCELLWAEVRG
jgi:hypothetical protein